MAIDCKLIKQQKCYGGSVEVYTHPSQATQTEMKFSIYRPAQALAADKSNSGAAIIWLSGLTCNEENFITKAGVFPWANAHGISVICPDTSPRGLDLPGEHESWDFGSGAGFYLNALTDDWKTNYNMYDYIVQEIPEILTSHFNVAAKKMSISGHSMGGHGALTIGLKNTDIFRSASAFSPIVAPTQCPWGEKAFSLYLGDDRKLWQEYDTVELLKKGDAILPILIDQGTSDDFLKEQLKTEILQAEVKKQNLSDKISVRMQEGYDHSYYFMASYIKDHIDFHAQYL